MRPYQISTTAYAAAAPTSICLSQTPGAAGNLTDQRRAGLGRRRHPLACSACITVTTNADESGKTLTVYGTTVEDGGHARAVRDGEQCHDYLVHGHFLRHRHPDRGQRGDRAAALTVGTAQAGRPSGCRSTSSFRIKATTISTDITGSLNYTWEFTNDNIWGDKYGNAPDPTTIKPFDHPAAALVGASADQYGSTTVLMRAVRLKINSGSGTSRNVVTQQSTQ